MDPVNAAYVTCVVIIVQNAVPTTSGIGLGWGLVCYIIGWVFMYDDSAGVATAADGSAVIHVTIERRKKKSMVQGSYIGVFGATYVSSSSRGETSM